MADEILIMRNLKNSCPKPRALYMLEALLKGALRMLCMHAPTLIAQSLQLRLVS